MTKLIDAHHHLWVYNSTDYGWMDASMDILKRDYLPPDLETELAEVGVNGTVVVQARQKLEETAWLLEQAEAYPFIKGVVGWMDLRSAELESQLDRFSRHPKLVGLRHVIHDEPDDDYMLRPAFLKGMEKLQEYELSYDLLLFPKHLSRAVELVSMFPEQRFVLDHLSKPFIRAGILHPWKEDIELLAAQANVWCKLSGMVTEASPHSWRFEDFIPYMKTVVEAFGTDRIMLGSDWPVCRLGGEYEEVMALPMDFLSTLNESEKENVFSNNAIDCYRLEK